MQFVHAMMALDVIHVYCENSVVYTKHAESETEH